MDVKTVVLQNESCSATYHITGGALSHFCLQPAGINPLRFCWEQPVKGMGNVFFRGHFLCLGRWGDPSAGEASKGHVKHGDFNRLQWQAEQKERNLKLSAHSPLEGLRIERDITIDKSAAVLQVSETVHNTHTVGRLFNLVQHPTLAAPFLNADTIVDCNAATGFDYAFAKYNERAFSTWPEIRCQDGESINLVRPERAYSSVFPFIVDPADTWGWLTAFSPEHQTVLGYVWRREHYPWLAHWLHFQNGQLQYRGLEFGTTGVHKPFKEIWEQGLLQLLGARTCQFIDAGEKQERSYMAFLVQVPHDFEGVAHVTLKRDGITIEEKKSKGKINIFHHLNTGHELSA